ATWVRRIGLHLFSKEAADISAIFAEQAQSLIFGVALKVDEEALPLLLYKGANACIRRFSENAVAAGQQGFFTNFIPPRVRHQQCRWCAFQNWMIRHLLLLKNTDALFTEWAPVDAVEVQDGRMHGKARPNRRRCSICSPIDD